MTTEEAVEIVLKGDSFILCDDCNLSGYIGEETCPRCKGYGSGVNPDYAEACQTLGRPLPQDTQRYWKNLMTKSHATIDKQPLRAEKLYMTQQDWDFIKGGL